MKKMMLVLFCVLTLVGHAQLASNKVLVPVRQNTLIQSSDWTVFEHELRVENPDEHLLSGFKLIQNGNYKDAIEELSQSIYTSKTSAEYAYFYRGIAKFALGQYKYAEIDFTKSLLIESRMADTYFFRALAKFELGAYEAACHDFQKTLMPGKALINVSSNSVYDAIKLICDEIPVDTSSIQGLAQF